MTELVTNIGVRVYHAPAAPATNTSAGFEALAWTEVAFPGLRPALGGSEHQLVSADNLATGYTVNAKGIANYPAVPLAFTDVENDAGQTALIAACIDAQGVGSIKVIQTSGAANAPVTGDPVKYAQGFYHGYLPTEGSAATASGFTATFQPTADTVSAAQPAP